jgi:hypothetical protein
MIPNWYHGPPYIAEGVVFDEKEIEHSHLTEEDAILSAMDESRTSGHPGYPHEAVMEMMKARMADVEYRYPHTGVLRFDRRTLEGEILHPYQARKGGDQWIVLLYLPFEKTFSEMSERKFIGLPIATAADITARAKRPSNAAD